MDPVCFLDMDGVVCDFTKGALAVHKTIIPPLEIKWDFWKKIGCTEQEFWSPFNREFWSNLEWTVEGKEILDAVESLFRDNIVLVTSPCETEGCVEGKRDWVSKHLPSYTRRLMIGPCKHLLAGKGKLLIDDSSDNINKFGLFGGNVLTVSRPWNDLSDEVDEKGCCNVGVFIYRMGVVYRQMESGG